ncbi:hypothetical protein BUALT_Bualt01G0006500 [Buddleja alternifolia]|uniref:Auxin response factor n=1 Tax=Buddleja alternifolia TaxID=168488 RepID=A0AAV6Y7J5_9LAMI|nr:hypothetical protein BUALT_Bualt01G0006500 [Buddleja alternifolia]
MSTSSFSTAAAAAEVDASVWRVLAGASVQIPSFGSYVYYFPQGHLEHSPASAAVAAVMNYNFNLQRPLVPCEVRSVRFLSNPGSDQAFVKILLQPLQPYSLRRSNNYDGVNAQNDVVSFAKVLTPSDANNGGGFSVPRYCADSIFPRLDHAADRPVQNLTFKDTLNNAWEFRHIYRGTPRRHLLTTGWNKFVNAKRLVAGDSVVFMRKRSTNELFVGIRRVATFGGDVDGGNGGDALEAIEKAARGITFEVVYYPRVGMPDFVVDAEKVKESLEICWSAGKRVRIGLETEDTARMTWYQGTITAAARPCSGPWCGSPWRMLQVYIVYNIYIIRKNVVSWDEPESLKGMNRVSPWQVEHLLLRPLLDSSEFLPSKRIRLLQNPGPVPNQQEESHLPTTQLTPSVAGHLELTMLNYSPFPAGIQGARQDHIRLSGSRADNSHQTFDELPKNDGGPEFESVSTVLSIGSPHSVSPGSRSSGQHGGHRNSFQLFGRMIQMSQPSNVIDNPSSHSPRQEPNGVLQLF